VSAGSIENRVAATEVPESESGATPVATLYARHRSELIAYVRRRFGAGPPDPEDIAQQAFANYAALGSRDAVANPRAFLFRTAHNIVLNDRKRARIGGRFFDSNPNPKEVCEARDDFNPEVVLTGRERYSVIETVIRAMPLKRRQCLLLNRIEGLSYVDIGRRLGLSESSVRKQVALAIRDCGAALRRADESGPKSRSGP
jgi:RNA polymerase sigma-70 factor (ECF subfamily)